MKIAFKVLLILFCISLTSCTKPVKVTAVIPARTKVESTVTTISSGTVHAENQAVMGFGVNGRVSNIFKTAGEKVKAGQKIAQLENNDLRLIFEQTSAEYERAKQLFDEKLVSKVAFDDARKALEIARANFDRSVIRSPFEGVIAEMNLDIGEQVSVAAVKFPVKVIDTKPRIVKGDIDEIDLAKVKVGQFARVRIPAARSEAYEAKVTKVVPYVDTTKEQDRTSQIELKLNADSSIPVGASAEIEIVTDQKESALAIPARAILGSGGTKFVFLVVNGRLEKRPVKLGVGNYEKVEVLEGVTEKELIALPSDTVELQDALKVKHEQKSWP